MAANPSLVPGGEHTLSATPTKLENGNYIGMSSVTLRSALGNDMCWIGLSDMTTGSQRRAFLLAGETLTLTYPSMTPDSIYLFGTAGDVIHWGSDQV